MNSHFDILTNMRTEWRWIGRRPSARAALRRLDERHPDLRLAEEHDLCDLLGLLESRGGRSVLERAEIVRALLEEATDPDIHRALLQTLLPGVVSVSRQLRFGDGVVDEPSEMVSVAISLLSELSVDWAGQSRTYAAPDLLSALRGRSAALDAQRKRGAPRGLGLRADRSGGERSPHRFSRACTVSAANTNVSFD